jgi:glutaryl-CoA dehydrogenase
VQGLKGALGCLTQARFGIAWGALGAARACYEAVVSYARERVAFGKPIASKQLVQQKIATWRWRSRRGRSWPCTTRASRTRQGISPVQVSLCKKNNVGWALEIARTARGILGGNGILLDYPVIRHMLNLESVYTYEGTDEVHTLILGNALTGHNAF